MNNILLLFFLSILSSLHTAALIAQPVITTGEIENVEATSATVKGLVDANGVETALSFRYGMDSLPKADINALLKSTSDNGVETSATITDLEATTTYFYQFIGQTEEYGTIEGEVKSFETPTEVITEDATEIGERTATLRGRGSAVGQSAKFYFEYSRNSDLSEVLTTPEENVKEENKPISALVDGLQPSTTYYFRLVSRHGNNKKEGAIKSFTTREVSFSVITKAATEISLSTAKLNGEVSTSGEEMKVHFAYGLSQDQLTSKIEAGTVQGNSTAVAAVINELQPNTTYYYKAVGTVGNATTEGEVLSFTTGSLVVTTKPATEITATAARLHGESPAGAALHFEYGTDQENLSNRVEAVRGSGNAVSAAVSGLASASTYFFRLVGTSGNSRVEGEMLSFTTPTEVVTEDAAEVSQRAAKLRGKGSAMGHAVEFFFEYSASSNLSAAQTTPVQNVQGANKEITATIGGLQPSTAYYFRLVSNNGNGRNEGNIKSFTTSGVTATVTTKAATEISFTSARLNGEVTSTGEEMTVHFEYGSSQDQLTSRLEAGTASGENTAVSAVANELQPGSTYYYRIVGTAGTTRTEGSVLSFTTGSLVVTTKPATEITATAARLHGESPAGAALHFEYGTDQENLSNRVEAVRGSGNAVSAAVSGLTSASTYFFRLVGTSGNSRVEGEIFSFTTPTEVVTEEATDIGQTTATLRGRASAAGQAAEFFFEYSKNRNLGGALATPVQNIQGASQEISASIADLQASTTYFYRLVSRMGNSRNEGAVKSFTTSGVTMTVLTRQASEVGLTSARFNGEISASGGEVNVRFEYGANQNQLTASLDAGKYTGANIPVSVLANNLRPATTYYYRAVGTMGATSTAGTIQNFTTRNLEVTTKPATEVTASSARLNGESAPSEASLHFEYGTSQANLSGRAEAVRGTGNAVSAAITGLATATTYYFRLVSTMGETRSDGEILSFITPPVATTEDAAEVSLASASLRGRGSAVGQEASFFFEYSKNSNLTGAATTAPQALQGDNITVTTELASLESGATYYYRLVGTVGSLRSEGAIKSFATSAVTVTTKAATEISLHAARLNAEVSAAGEEVTVHFEYGLAQNQLTSRLEAGTASGNNTAVSALASELQPNTTYFYKAVGTVGTTRTEGAVLSFTTSALAVTTRPATEVTASTARLNGESPASGATLHFEYGTNQASLGGRAEAVRGTGNAVTAAVTGLASATTYYFRLVGTSGSTRVEGEILSFTTPPIAVTADAFDITQTSAKIRGRGTAMGQEATFFFEYSKNSNLSGAITTAPQAFQAENREVISELNSLEPGVTYYYRLVGTLGNLRSAGEIKSFTTTGAMVSTMAATEVSATGARLNGQASAFGVELALQFEYGTDRSNLNLKLPAGTITTNNAAVTAVASQLNPATTYYYRLVGLRGATRMEGEILSFTTGPGVLTGEALEITPTTARLSGKATAVGTEANFFFEYSTSSNLSNAIATPVQAHQGTGVDVLADIANLEPGTVYYYRLVGTLGTMRTEGAIKSFSTLGLVLTTKAATDITPISAVLHGLASAFGTELRLVFEYGTTRNNLNLTINAGTITGNDQPVKASPPNLDPGTTYYYRLVGLRANDRIEGQVLSFTTPAVVVTGEAAEITPISAKLQGTGTSIGQAAEYFFEYGTSNNLANAASTGKISSQGLNQPIAITATNLEPSTIYYYRLVGMVGSLRSAGEIKSFKTIGLSVSTKAATEVGPTSAKLNGEASTFGTTLMVYFRLGKDQEALSDSIPVGNVSGNAKPVQSTVSDLEPGTTYYFQLVGERGSEVLKGEIMSFTTTSPIVQVEAATLITASGARLNGKVTTYGTELRLHFEYGVSQNNLSSRVNAVPATTSGNNVTVHADALRLESARVYYYRLVGTSTSGKRFYSSIRSLETSPAVSNITYLREPEFVDRNDAGAFKPDSVVVQLNPNPQGTVAKLIVKGYRESFDEAKEYVMHTGANGTYTHALPAEQFDELGLTYYVEVTPPAGFGTKFNSAEKYVAIHYEENGLEFTEAIPFSRDSLEYRMIAFPVQHDQPESVRKALVEVLGSPDRRSWRMFGYDPVEARYIEYPNDADFGRISAGAGYWILAAPQQGKPASYKLQTGEGKTVLSKIVGGFYQINLEKGWNLIGNPLPFDVPWRDILSASDMPFESELSHWKNKSFIADSVLRQFSGAFVWSDEPDTLRIPVMKSFDGGKGPSTKRGWADNALLAEEPPALELDLSMSANGRQYSRAGLGMHPHASISKDKYDQMLLPRLFSPFDISFRHEEYFAPYFARDIVPVAESYVWNFDVTAGPSEGVVTLSWGIKANVTGKELWLHDLNNDRIVNMQEETGYKFRAGEKNKFKVYYGSSEFIREHLKPLQARLLRPYPNPFFDTTHIAFTLTEESAGRVKMSVFDIRGSEVMVLTEQEYTEGFHEISWDGRDQQGNRLQSGVYIIKVQISGKSSDQLFTEKIVLY